MRWMLLALFAVGCATVPPRFKDQAVVWEVDDTRNVAEEPREREFYQMPYFGDLFVLRRSTRALALHDREPAWDTNSLDEVPDSTWFTNRIGIYEFSPEEVATGPATEPPPKPPLEIVAGKSGGGNPGFIAKDATGRRFVVKFDTPENPRMQTGTNAIVNRFFWAAGYNVPADYVFWFRIEDLTVGDGAKAKDELGRKKPITDAMIAEMMVEVPREPDGSIRATASKFLDGVPVGGWPAEGVRKDDPNDTIPHQHRRHLRGLRVLSAWLGHTDMKSDNTLDMYVERDGRRFLKHYLVDFGEALGAHRAEKLRPEDGFEHLWDWQRNGLAAFTLGLWVRPWESLEDTQWLSVGSFDAEHFKPERWREAYPYWPFMEADRADLYWGAKITMRFTRPHIEAVVAEGKFSDGASKYLVDTLVKRRDKIGRAWLNSVTPLDWFRVEAGEVCFTDLAVHYGVRQSSSIEVLSAENDHAIDLIVLRADGSGCYAVGNKDYTVLRLRVRHHDAPPMQVHVRAGPNPQVLGIVRVE